MPGKPPDRRPKEISNPGHTNYTLLVPCRSWCRTRASIVPRQLPGSLLRCLLWFVFFRYGSVEHFLYRILERDGRQEDRSTGASAWVWRPLLWVLLHIAY